MRKKILLMVFSLLLIRGYAQDRTVFLLEITNAGADTGIGKPRHFIYAPGFRCRDVDSLHKGVGCREDILTSVYKAKVYETVDFTLDLDKYSAFSLKSKGTRQKEIFLEYYMSKNLSAKDNIYIIISSDAEKVHMEFYKSSATTLKGDKLGEKDFMTTDMLAVSNGKFGPSFLKYVKENLSVYQENAVTILKVPMDVFPQLVALRFELYNKAGKRVIEEAGLKASENVIYTKSLPKGEYTWKVFLTYGDLLTEGKIKLK